jgi:hypothetical protein
MTRLPQPQLWNGAFLLIYDTESCAAVPLSPLSPSCITSWHDEKRLYDETPFWPSASDILRDWAARLADAFRSGAMIEHTTFPIDPVLFYTFLIAAVLIEITPGPNMAYLVTLLIST